MSESPGHTEIGRGGAGKRDLKLSLEMVLV